MRTDGPAGSYVEQSYPDLGDPTQQRARTETPAPPGAGGVGWAEAYFDGLGRTWKTVSRGPATGQDIVVERRYDVRGLPEEVTEPRYSAEAERVTHYEYDALGRVTRVELPGERELLTSYEATSQTATDPDGKQATSRFDAYGRLIATERSLNGQPVITQTRYDALGRRIGMTDPAGVEWTWAYDSLGRVREEWDPDAGHRTATYDKAGRPLTQTDAKGQTTTQTYEPLVGRLQSRVNASGTVNYTYSQARTGCQNVGRLTGMTHIVSSKVADTLELDYDALGRVWKQRRKIGATTYAVQKTLDAGGYLQSTTYPDGDVVGGLTYDGAGRLAAIPGITTALTYDALGRPLTRTNANSTQTTWSYTDPRGFLTQIQTSGPQGTVQDVQYTEHTDAGLLQRVTSPISGEGWSYAYDDLNHMTTATHLQNPAESQSFTYDAADRILTSSRYGAYSYPGAQQAHPHAPSSVNGTALVYDLNGNVTQAGTRSVVWNADNLPSRVTLSGFRTDFTYDGFGERLKKTSSQGTSLYPFGDDYEITGGVVTKYISVEGLGVIAKRVGNGPAGAVTYWIHTDRLGSIQAVTSSGSNPQYPAGTVVWRRTYRPFGETLAQSGPLAESRGWIDQRNDTETGLTYLHARYFDPQLGTFLSADPIGVEGGMNQYGYGLGDPVNSFDASGLSPNYVFCYPWPMCGGGTPSGNGNGNVNFQFGTPGGGGDLGPLLNAVGNAIGSAFDWFFHPSSHNLSWDPSVPRPTAYVPGKPIDPNSDYELGSLTLVSLVPTAGAPPTVAQPPPPPPPPAATPQPTPPRTHVDPWKGFAISWTNDRLLEEYTARRETCTTLCIGTDGALFLTTTQYGSGSGCTPLGCPPGSRRLARGHTHPDYWLGGHPGHQGDDLTSPRDGHYFSWIGLRIPNAAGTGITNRIYFYDYRTNTETYWPRQ